MKLFARSLSSYLTGIARQILVGQTDSRELRIFLSSFAPEIVHEVGLQLREFIASQPKHAGFVYKVGTSLWESWQRNAEGLSPQVLNDIQQENWVDVDDKLTFYRNLKWDRSSGKDCLIVMLIGVEQARDHASLKDFYLVDASKIWHEELRCSFLPWLELVMGEKHISTEPEQYQQMNELLKRLYSYGAGDLVRIADFLEAVSFDSAQDGIDALGLMYEHLPFWDLPLLRDISLRKQRTKYLDAAIRFFSYQPYLKEYERKKALKKIDLFEKKQTGGDASELPEGVAGLDDFLNCLRRYISKNDVQSRQKLLQVDFAFVKDQVLGIKNIQKSDTEAPEPKAPKTAKIDAPPLEAVLKAIWMTFVTFKKECERNKVEPQSVLKAIKLQGLKFLHDFGEDAAQAHRVLKGLLGGLDSFLERYLTFGHGAFETDEQNIIVESRIYHEERISLDSSRASIPSFEFSVEFEVDELTDVMRTFRWMLPETHPYRNVWNFAQKVRESLQHERGVVLPIFHIPYYHELFLAPDEEEVNRIFFLGLNHLSVRNLLNDREIKKQRDPLWLNLEELSDAYGKFLQEFVDAGYFQALLNTWPALLKKTEAVFAPIVNNEKLSKTALLPLVYKAFLLLRGPSEKQQNYIWQSHLESAVITPLHPALLEMLQHRETFLIYGFLEKFRDALDSGAPINEQQWRSVCDLATVHCPLFGLIGNQRKEIDTRIEAFGLMHHIGKPTPSGATLAAKVLLRYDSPEDEDISEADLFRQSRESKVITRILREYLKLHPYAQDGLSVAVLNAVHIQPIIAGVDAFIKEYLEPRAKEQGDSFPPFYFSLTLFMPSSDSEAVSRWLQEWRTRWDPAQIVEKFGYYQACRLSVSHRVVGKREEYERLLTKGRFEADVAILAHFITNEESGNEVEPAEAYRVDYSDPLKFPIVEMARCVESHPSRRHLRSRVLSNRRFRLAALHSELTARVKNQNERLGQEHIVISLGDYSPWISVLDRLHQHATWVLCLDPLIDERLIYNKEQTREIIGFSSGVGLNGELNYTVSTERSSLDDVEKRIRAQVLRLFGPWENSELETAAHSLVQHSRKLSGLSLVRATGPSEYVRDLIAYTLVRLSLPPKSFDGELLCDELLALDSFLHWFEGNESKERPDLMRIVAFLQQDGSIRVFATLIECKLAKSNSVHVEKARIQLESGLRQLIPLFRPRNQSSIRFDQRFWWTQLQRLIATKAEIESEQQQRVTAALEELANGYFSISWQAMAVTFWTDSDQQTFDFSSPWNFQEQQQEFTIAIVSAGTELVKKICCDREPLMLPESQSFLTFECSQDRSFGGFEVQRQTEELVQEASETSIEKEHSLKITSEDSTNPVRSFMPPNAEDSPLVRGKEWITEPDGSPKADDSPLGRCPEPAEERGKGWIIPQRIFLGQTKEGRDIFWEYGHPGLTNRHLLIFGKSGSGKTYAIQALLMELAKQKQNAAIIDYTSGFLPNHLETEFRDSVKPQTHLVRQKPLPLNPFRQQQQVIEGFDPIPEDPYAVGTRVTSVFTSVYSTIGEQQKAALIKAIEDGLVQYGPSFNFENLLEMLEEEGNTGLSLANKINPLVRAKIFAAGGEQTWQAMFQAPKHRVNIMQLAGVAREIARMATEFILWDLYDFATNHGNKNRPLPMVLDEIQNLDHRLSSPLAKILTEGRKFGLSMILATQTLSNLQSEERDRLFQASQKLFFKPAETEVREYAKILEHSTHERLEIWIKRLSSLGKGECYAFGPSANPATGTLEEKAFPIKITVLGERM
ncbi:MAG: ATP-binding protein [bacterium]|nr:ATP-binding protein [bacterium]